MTNQVQTIRQRVRAALASTARNTNTVVSEVTVRDRKNGGSVTTIVVEGDVVRTPFRRNYLAKKLAKLEGGVVRIPRRVRKSGQTEVVVATGGAAAVLAQEPVEA